MLELKDGALPGSPVSVPCYDLDIEKGALVLIEAGRNISFDPADLSSREKQYWQMPHRKLVGLIALEHERVMESLSQNPGQLEATLNGTTYRVSPIFDEAKPTSSSPSANEAVQISSAVRRPIGQSVVMCLCTARRRGGSAYAPSVSFGLER